MYICILYTYIGFRFVDSFEARELSKTLTNETMDLDGEDAELYKQITADFAAINCKFEDTRISKHGTYP